MINIALIGPRGVGKSKVSRKLSKLTGMPIVSTDMIAIYESGCIPISEIIKKDGGNWKNFRKLESAVLLKISKAQNIIVDCGGGILFDVDEKGNEFFSLEKFTLLKSFSRIIGLSKSKNYLINKIKSDPSRPTLSSIESYENLLDRRLPYYRSSSEYYIDTNDISTEETAAEIVSLLKI
ncbi:MAG: shikimate kinase [Leptospiraceae bacterium]|nr:shikimate kinase [Leptospiraceae bacterium]MCP5494808.1 shikimate kinase [Leptospiraceae bacterium]